MAGMPSSGQAIVQAKQYERNAREEAPHGGYKQSGYGKDISLYWLDGVHVDRARHGLP